MLLAFLFINKFQKKITSFAEVSIQSIEIYGFHTL